MHQNWSTDATCALGKENNNEKIEIGKRYYMIVHFMYA